MNAKYSHAAFGLRCLLANLGPAAERTVLVERTIADRPSDVVEEVLAYHPRVVALGVYIWNAPLSLEVVQHLKKLAPEVVVVLGGPEVSHELDAQPLVALADYVVTGEGEVAFRGLVESLLLGQRPPTKVLAGGKPTLEQLVMPYAHYSSADLAQRIVYVEASRGCPYTCEFCLSALDDGVRAFPLDAFLREMNELLRRGLKAFKFVDRTFNLKLDVSLAILRFFRAKLQSGVDDLFLHFEMIPDRLPEALRAELALFPPGVVQLEVGVQTLNPAVGATIRRRQDVAKLVDNLRFLRAHTQVHVHADLIAGLPGEDLASFGQGFDQLSALGPHEIQVGLLKRLRGAPVARHTETHGMLYADAAPYEVLQTAALTFEDVQRLKRFSRYFDLVHNSGRFPRAAAAVMHGPSAFAAFLEFSDWVWSQTRATSGIALPRLGRLVERYLVEARGRTPADAAELVAADLTRSVVARNAHAARQARHEPAARG
jgi:radical SAM superfamily enzyme YgiQ (UPF0313 family)